MKRITLLSIMTISFLYSQISWGPEVRITPDSVGTWYPRAAIWGDTIHLVWQNVSSDDIFYMCSTDRGDSWGQPVNLTENDPDDAWTPWITVWGNKVHVVYTDGISRDSLMYIRSLDGGNTWESPRRLLKPGGDGIIVSIGDTLYLIGGSNPQWRFFIIKSFDGGNTWGTPQTIDTTTGGRRLEVYSPYLYITAEGSAQTYEIFYFRSPDKGNTWEGPFVISPDDNRASQLPTMSVSDSSVYIAWSDWASFFTDYIFERHSHDNGSTFSPYQNLAPLGRARRSEIYTNGNFVILVWSDNRLNGGTDFDLFWRMSTDGGNTWTSEELLSDTSAKVDVGFCITGYGNDVYVFWSDKRNNDLTLYFKKGVYVNVKETEGRMSEKRIGILSSNILFLPDKIRFFVKNGEEYSLSLFDLQGRKIMTLKEGIGKGKEEVVLKEMNSDNYFLVLETNSKILKKKILILKGGKKR